MAELLSNTLLDHSSLTVLLPDKELLVHRACCHLNDAVALPCQVRAASCAEPAQVIFDDLVVGKWSGGGSGRGGPGEAASG